MSSDARYITFNNTWRDDVQVRTVEQKPNYGIIGDPIIKAFQTKKILMTDGRYRLYAIKPSRDYVTEVDFFVKPEDKKFKVEVDGNLLLKVSKQK